MPKGVAIAHRSAAALVRWARSAFQPDELAAVLASTSITFNLSVFELFAPLAAGGRVVLVENALRLAELSGAEGVTLVNTVPSAMTELVRMRAVPAAVRAVALAGEPLRRRLAADLHELGVARVLNLYGPSEATTYSTFAEVGPGDAAEPSIGRPIAGTRAYLLDRELEPVPVGVPAQICLAGEGLARGYLGRPDLTAERFLPDPFSGEAGGRLYRTGDLARWRPDGDIEFLGRFDHQVKVRGFRIELGEIEAALVREPEVAEAAVVVQEDAGGRRLVACLVPASGAEDLDLGRLRSALRTRLPEPMVPAAFAVLPALPLTPNGKIDRRALAGLAETSAAPARSTAREPEAPRTSSKPGWSRSAPIFSTSSRWESTTTSSTSGGIRSWPCSSSAACGRSGASPCRSRRCSTRPTLRAWPTGSPRSSCSRRTTTSWRRCSRSSKASRPRI